MSISFRNYNNDTRFCDDYNNVCDFLQRINKNQITTPFFMWARWAWMISRPVDNEYFKNRIGIWEDEGKIIALATFESFGNVFVCVDKEYEFLREDIIKYAEESLSNDSSLKIIISDEDKTFENLAIVRGYKATQEKQCISVMDLECNLNYNLPSGYSIVSMKKDWDFHQYNRVMWQGFGHEGEPNQEKEEIDWRKSMLSSPHIVPELILSIVAPDGNYVAHCGLWYNLGDDYSYVEPVATIPKYRKMGLAKSVVYEALKRAKVLGARKAFVASSQEFYYTIGFEPYSKETWWEINR